MSRLLGFAPFPVLGSTHDERDEGVAQAFLDDRHFFPPPNVCVSLAQGAVINGANSMTTSTYGC